MHSLRQSPAKPCRTLNSARRSAGWVNCNGGVGYWNGPAQLRGQPSASCRDLLWAGGCHPLLLRAGRSQDSARLVARCERVLLPGDPLRQTVRESLTNIAGG